MLLTQTTTTEVPRIVGDPLPLWVWWGAGVLLFVFIVLGGIWASRRMNSNDE